MYNPAQIGGSMDKPTNRKTSVLEKISFKVINWVGTPQSLVVHTIVFAVVPALALLGFELRSVLIILTTWLSIEAIYLAIFIQMTVNKTTTKLDSVEDDIEDIQEDVKGLETDVEEISEDIDQIQVEEKSEEENTEETLEKVETQLQKVIENLEHLRKQVHQHPST